MHSQADPVFTGLDYYLAREASQNDGVLPESFPVHIADLTLVPMGLHVNLNVEKRGEDYFYRGVRLLRDDTIFRVRLDIPSPNQKPEPAMQSHMRVFLPMVQQWKAFLDANGQKPNYTSLSPQALEDFAAKASFSGAEDEQHYIDTGELRIYWGNIKDRITIKADPTLTGLEMRCGWR